MRPIVYSLALILFLSLPACDDPPPGPSAAELEAAAAVRAAAAEALSASARDEARAAEEGEVAEVPGGPELPEAVVALRNFAGFSSDGTRFAYGSGSMSGAGAPCVLWVTEVGSTSADILASVYDEGEVASAQAALEEGGFTASQIPAPETLQLEANLTATPPTVTLRRGASSATHSIEDYPFPPTDSASVFGMSPSGSHVVIRVQGPQVDGLLTRAGPGFVRFYRVIPLP